MNDRIREIEPYGVTFYENRERPLNVRMAMASREAAKYCSVWIDAKNYIGYTASGCPTSGMTYNFGSGIAVNNGKFEDIDIVEALNMKKGLDEEQYEVLEAMTGIYH